MVQQYRSNPETRRDSSILRYDRPFRTPTERVIGPVASRLLFVFVLSWAILGRPAAGRQVTAVGVAYADTLVSSSDRTVQLRPFVIPGSVSVAAGDRELTDSEWTLQAATGRMELSLPPGTLIHVTYRAFPLSAGPVFRLDREPLPVPDRISFSANPRRQSEGNPGASGLRSRGAISRGITAGSGRDASIESGLRLEVDGSPAPGVSVRAALTDESTPIRPDGTTQRLSEFDRVSVEITARQSQVRMGDIDVALTSGRFARFRRKVQGVAVRSTIGSDENAPLSIGLQASGAASRGLFRVQTLVPVDGLQGPYRLEGQNGELFLLVIPGSEIVYLDGVRLERGATLDYTIDYSTAEVTFMQRVPVTSDRRIEIEFSYSINQFTRTVIATEGAASFWRGGNGRHRATFGVTWLRESDGSRFADELGLSSDDSLLISAAGDSEALQSGAVEVVFDPEAPYVQYRRELRTRTGGSTDTVYVALEAAPAGGEAVYRVRFSRVDTGEGHYAREGQSVNGIVYVYRGSGGGDYEPVRRLPRPELRRLIDIRGSVTPVRGVTLDGEWARSLHDRNRLSARDSGDDGGNAYTGSLALSPPITEFGRVSAGASIVRRTEHFTSFDRTRSVEFGREWNLGRRSVDPVGAVAGAGDEFEAGGFVSWASGDSTGIRAEIARLDIGDLFDGRRVKLSLHSFESGLPGTRYSLDLVDSRDREYGERGQWEYHRARVQAPRSARLLPYLDLEREIRRQRLSGDSLQALSVAYTEIRPGVEWTSESATAAVEIERRQERRPLGTRLADASSSWAGRLRARYAPVGDWSASGEISWRERTFSDEFATQPDAANTRSLAVQFLGDGRPMSRLRLAWMYSAQTERSPTLQEVYFRAGPERGEYVWADDNGDGVIQVDEFVPETTPDEGLYVRTWLPSDSLASVTVAQARIRLTLLPAQGRLGFVSGQTLFDVEERSRTSRRGDVYFLRLDRFRIPGTTLNGRIRFRQDVSLWRGSSGFGIDASVDATRTLTELAAGRESRSVDRQQLAVRGRPRRSLDVAINLLHEVNTTESDAFASRRFNLRTRGLSPSARLRLGSRTTLRAEFSLAWKRDRRVVRKATVIRLPLSARTGLSEVVDLSTRLELADIRLSGNATGLAAWEITEGRGPGRSVLWGTTVQWAVSRILRATLAYDGRAPATGPVIHTGRLEVSAVF